MATLIAVKTKYHSTLEDVHSKLMKGKRKCCRLSDPKDNSVGIWVKLHGRSVLIDEVGANSFGIEVHYVESRFWGAIDELGVRQQLAIANAIDWQYLY